MTRLSDNVIDFEGFVRSGFDYRHQVWVVNYIVKPCGHPLSMRARGVCCNQNKYAGLDVRELYKTKGGVNVIEQKTR